MARARAAEHGAETDAHGGATRQVAPPPADPLKLVRAAIGGEDLLALTRRAAEACGRTVALALPERGTLSLWPEAGDHTQLRRGLEEYARAQVAVAPATLPDGVIDAVAVRLGADVVGVAAATGPGPAEIAVRPWLEAVAAAAAVALLLLDGGGAETTGAQALLEGLEAQPPADLAGLLHQGRRLGSDLHHGAVGLCALLVGDGPAAPPAPGVLVAEVGAGRLLGLVPLAGDGDEAVSEQIVAQLRAAGAVVACSAPRHSPELLSEALLEAALLAELIAAAPQARIDPAQEETYRLLIGVLLRTPTELTRLRLTTIAELERYDAMHDTELLATLEVFLAHHGSTTETAEALGLHRHTVGYRLARVQEVSGLSPYESEGRERLSLGLKVDRILAAEDRRAVRARSMTPTPRVSGLAG